MKQIASSGLKHETGCSGLEDLILEWLLKLHIKWQRLGLDYSL